MSASPNIMLAIVAGLFVVSNTAEATKSEPKWLWPGLWFPLPALTPPAAVVPVPPATACGIPNCCKDFFTGITAGDTCTAGTPPTVGPGTTGVLSTTKCLQPTAPCTAAACTSFCASPCAAGPTSAICP